MILKWKENEKPIVTEKAIGYKVNQEIMWIPKKMLMNPYKPSDNSIEIPDWLYDKKIEELYLK